MKKEHLMMLGSFAVGAIAGYYYHKAQASKASVVVMTDKSEMIGGFGGKKMAGRKSCQMANGEYVLVAAGTPCTSVGGSEIK